MNPRRWMALIALGALLLGQSLPAQAGRMLCGMKERVKVDMCSRCDDPQGLSSGSALRAGSCCRFAPVPATESTPLVLSTPRIKVASDELRSLEPAAGPVVYSGLPRAASLSRSGPHSEPPPFLESPTRTTVLRN